MPNSETMALITALTTVATAPTMAMTADPIAPKTLWIWWVLESLAHECGAGCYLEGGALHGSEELFGVVRQGEQLTQLRTAPMVKV